MPGAGPLVDHRLTEHNVEELPPSVGNSGGLDVDVAALHRLGTIEVEPWVEESCVLSCDHPALRLRRQGGEI